MKPWESLKLMGKNTMMKRSTRFHTKMDKHIFMMNTKRAVSYLNSLNDIVKDQFLKWDPKNQLKVQITSAHVYHSLFPHNMCTQLTFEKQHHG